MRGILNFALERLIFPLIIRKYDVSYFSRSWRSVYADFAGDLEFPAYVDAEGF
jgi:hypothetical protein